MGVRGGFFPTAVAFRAGFRVACQLEVQAQARWRQGLVKSLPLADVHVLDGGPQRRHCRRGEGLQHARARRLVGTPFPPPRGRERRIRPEAGVELLQGRTVREDTDHDVAPLLVGLVKNGLATELDVLPPRGEAIRVVQDVSQGR
jgi:hypothetical protein